MKTFSMFSSRVLVGLVLAAASLGSLAQDFKIGAVNIERVLRDSTAAKAVSTKLEQEFSKRDKELTASIAQLKTASEKFDREAPTLPESQRTTRQRQLVDQDRELQRKQREFQEDLNLRKNEGLQQVVEKLNRVLKQVAEAEKYDVILQEAAYINPRIDITDKVISIMDGAK